MMIICVFIDFNAPLFDGGMIVRMLFIFSRCFTVHTITHFLSMYVNIIFQPRAHHIKFQLFIARLILMPKMDWNELFCICVRRTSMSVFQSFIRSFVCSFCFYARSILCYMWNHIQLIQLKFNSKQQKKDTHTLAYTHNRTMHSAKWASIAPRQWQTIYTQSPGMWARDSVSIVRYCCLFYMRFVICGMQCTLKDTNVWIATEQ